MRQRTRNLPARALSLFLFAAVLLIGQLAQSHVINTLTPRKCFRMNHLAYLGVLKVRVKKISGEGVVRLFVDRGSSCRLGTGTLANSQHDFTSGLLLEEGMEKIFYITADSSPPLQRGYWAVSVIGDRMLPGQLAEFEVEITNPLWSSSAANPRRGRISITVLTVTAIVAIALALYTFVPSTL